MVPGFLGHVTGTEKRRKMLSASLAKTSEAQKHIICCAGGSLSDIKWPYSQTEKRWLLHYVDVCEHAPIYGILEFNLVTDHMPVEAIDTIKSKPSARWVLRLRSSNGKVQYIPESCRHGKRRVKAT